MLRVILLITVFASAGLANDADFEFFENRIRPALVKHCYECHSVDGDVSGGLLLDSRDGWQRGGDSGEAIVVGEPSRSRLLEAITYANRDLQMPPDGKLPERVVADFRKWIREGAHDPRDAKLRPDEQEFDLDKRAAEHWAWQPRRSFDESHSIDQFIDSRLAEQELRRSPASSADTLIRRLSFDLIGLPPSPIEIEEFVKANDVHRESAIEELVDRLLQSPRFGEKWASHWFDVVDYSETKGHVTDQERPYAWKYRDYVIDALNDDVPYDRFVLEHIAGDLLPPELQRPGRDGQTNVSPTATGVLFMHEMHFMAVDPVQQRWDEIDAQIDMVGKAFLGLTLECARCHDHKFDAVSQQDYYALAGFFYNTEQAKHRTAAREPIIDSDTAKQVRDAEADYEKFLNQKRDGRVKALTPKNKSGRYFPISEELGIQTTGDTDTLLKKMRSIQRLDPSWGRWVRAAADVDDGKDVTLLVRGEPTNEADVVPRRFLTAIDSTPPSLAGSGRRWLAEKIVEPKNPLTARVHANRIWHHLFSRGIVATPNDFGKLGEPPTHPKLLDYLAQRLIESGWSTKSLIREIVLSKTYQQSSRVGRDLANTLRETDPTNKWLSHQNRRRLTGEQIRDAMLAVSGSIDLAMYGPGVDPYVPPYATANKTGHIPKPGPIDGANRRSVYIKARRNFFDPFLRTFDFPERGKPVGKRGVTIAPNQALAMLNNPLVHELAGDWGVAISQVANEQSVRQKIQRMWKQGLGRIPSEDELDAAEELVASLSSQEDVASSATPIQAAPSPLVGSRLSRRESKVAFRSAKVASHDHPQKAQPRRESNFRGSHDAWKQVAHLIFNHPDFLWID